MVSLAGLRSLISGHQTADQVDQVLHLQELSCVCVRQIFFRSAFVPERMYRAGKCSRNTLSCDLDHSFVLRQ